MLLLSMPPMQQASDTSARQRHSVCSIPTKQILQTGGMAESQVRIHVQPKMIFLLSSRRSLRETWIAQRSRTQPTKPVSKYPARVTKARTCFAGERFGSATRPPLLLLLLRRRLLVLLLLLAAVPLLPPPPARLLLYSYYSYYSHYYYYYYYHYYYYD